MNFKKTISVIAISISIISSSFANQFSAKDSLKNNSDFELINKKGISILPEAGDWAVAFDAVPLLEYTASVFSNNMNTPEAAFTKGFPISIAGKYFVENNYAYRARTMLNIGRVSESVIVQNDREINDNPDATLSDTKKSGYSNVVLAFGIEKRKGKTRIQGIYGAEAILLFSRSKTTYEYGNSFTEGNTNPSTGDFQDGNIVAPGQRILSTTGGNTFGFGARAFLGVEFFIMPKLSLGMEYGMAMLYSTTNQRNRNIESWDTPNQAISRKLTPLNGAANSFGLNGEVSGGAINLTFYF
jgi:hypothetical protein